MVVWSCPLGSVKEDDSDVSYVCYLRCKKIIGSLKVNVDL